VTRDRDQGASGREGDVTPRVNPDLVLRPLSPVAQFILPAILENNLPLFHRRDRRTRAPGLPALPLWRMDNGNWRITSSDSGARIGRRLDRPGYQRGRRRLPGTLALRTR
jgi:hypothetical protein